MVVKKLIGKMVVALIRAMVRAIFGMLVGVALIGLILIMLLLFGVLMPEVGGIMEIFSLLLVGASVGAIVGFFDLLDVGARRSRSRESLENSQNHLPQSNGHGPLGSVRNNTWQSTSDNSRGQP
jgi:ABC-type transport system involved in cytochrome bd biosynthesis fused ATPase/permease subunit